MDKIVYGLYRMNWKRVIFGAVIVAIVIVAIVIVIWASTRQGSPIESFRSSNTYKIGGRTEAEADPGFIQELNRYAASIDPVTLEEKCGDAVSYQRGFWRHVLEKEDLEAYGGARKLQQTLEEAMPSDKRLLAPPFRYLLVRDRLEQAMPFTLAGWVVMPASRIHLSRAFTSTLCHEQMHVLQWRFPDLHRGFIEKEMRFREVAIRGQLPVTVYANPDGFQEASASWIFEEGGRYYCPYLVQPRRGRALEKLCVEVIPTREGNYVPTAQTRPLEALLGNRYPMCPLSQRYHPMEILAEVGAHYLLDGTTGSAVYDRFYMELSSLSSSK